MKTALVPAGIGLCIAALLLLGSGGGCSEAVPPALSIEATQAAADGSNQFALDLYAQLPDEGPNVCICPFGVRTALATAYAGARGETARQMAEVLHAGGAAGQLHRRVSGLSRALRAGAGRAGYEVHTANALWVQSGYDLLPEFRHTVRGYYDAQLARADFATEPEEACRRINGWVGKRTRSRIPRLLDPGALDRETVLALVNAVYLKALWQHEFLPQHTAPGRFRVSEDRSVEVPMMKQTAGFRHGAWEGGRAVELPYRGAELSMVVLLPDEGRDLEAFAAGLTKAVLAERLESFQDELVTVVLPRFKLSWGGRLGDALRDLGMRDAFSRAEADFSGVGGRRGLFLSLVQHRTYLAVDERGTEAAAATAALLKSAVREENVVRVDRPFLFVIRHVPSSAILFIGHVRDPSAGEAAQAQPRQ
ncbi:MAG: serpin family protein [Candidatus Brocadiia bacterium]